MANPWRSNGPNISTVMSPVNEVFFRPPRVTWSAVAAPTSISGNSASVEMVGLTMTVSVASPQSCVATALSLPVHVATQVYRPDSVTFTGGEMYVPEPTVLTVPRPYAYPGRHEMASSLGNGPYSTNVISPSVVDATFSSSALSVSSAPIVTTGS